MLELLPSVAAVGKDCTCRLCFRTRPHLSTSIDAWASKKKLGVVRHAMVLFVSWMFATVWPRRKGASVVGVRQVGDPGLGGWAADAMCTALGKLMGKT